MRKGARPATLAIHPAAGRTLGWGRKRWSALAANAAGSSAFE
jgi:hypothetical protein